LIKELEYDKSQLQLENASLIKNINQISKSHGVEDAHSFNKNLEYIIVEKEIEIDKYIKDFNYLSRQTDELMIENRVLREMANVPDNYGLNLKEIKQHQKIELEE